MLIDWLCHLAPGQTTPTAGSDALDAVWVTRDDLSRMPGLEQVAIDLVERTMVEEGQV